MSISTAAEGPCRGHLRAGFRALLLAAAVCWGAPLLAEQTVGLLLNDEAAFEGYTLFAPLPSWNTYLIDNEGRLVRSWNDAFRPGDSVYLLDNGDLLRTGKFAPAGIPRFTSGGAGGRVRRFDWEGALVWDFVYSNAGHRQHHDIERLPDGNVLMIAWELKSGDEAIAAGRDPLLLTGGELWPDQVIEVEPVGGTGGNIVWEWHVWDHLIQQFDPTKDHFGIVADHPERVDLNFVPSTGGNPGQADWLHVNAIDYNETLDQILLSVPRFGEIWVIDHGTTTAQAAGHTGGNSGMGGDLLYRWGNPLAYGRGTLNDRKLYGQHDTQWIPPGLPGAGHMLVFNNGNGRPQGNYSTVDEFAPPVDQNGAYELPPGSAYGPAGLVWTVRTRPAPHSRFLDGSRFA